MSLKHGATIQDVVFGRVKLIDFKALISESESGYGRVNIAMMNVLLPFALMVDAS